MRRNGITVIGTATATTPVDHVTITLGVSVIREDPGDSFRVAAATATALLALLSDHGIDSRSVRTSSLSLGPQWEYRDGRNQRIGYQAEQSFTVVIEGLAGVDRMLTDVAVGAGEGVTISGISLTSQDPTAALTLARREAFQNAAAAAAELAALSGRALGRVEWIEERGGHDEPAPRIYRAAAFAAKDSASMPVAGGDTSVSVTLDVHFGFAD
jgi:uncharacterized protein YggE